MVGQPGCCIDRNRPKRPPTRHHVRVSAFDTPAYTGEKVPEALLPLWFLLMGGGREIRWGVHSPIDRYFVDHPSGIARRA
jgi:hypothetical protein